VVTEVAVSLGAAESSLERRAEMEQLDRSVEELEADLAGRQTVAARAATEARTAWASVEVARAEESRLTGARRAAEDAERLAARQLESVVREATWHEAQVGRLLAEQERARTAAALLDAGTAPAHPAAQRNGSNVTDGAAIAAWEARAAELQARRDRLAEEAGIGEAIRREAEHGRAGAEAAVRLANERTARAERDLIALGERDRALSEARDALRGEVAQTAAREVEAREALAAARAIDAADRERLTLAEGEAVAARDRLRAADERLRTADHADLETRLGLDALREAVVAEFAALGPLGIARLEALAGIEESGRLPEPADPDDEAGLSAEVAALEAALAAVAPSWAARPPTEAPPGPARLNQLRRRFRDLGAANPYAVDEYAALKARLERLDGQAADLRTAIDRTRELIGELDTMISERFQATFRALETAFASRFEQLFGGGFARLSLTDPADIGSSGIEIVARPPGKKSQALAVLSGGERALTAVALLFAMLEVRPVPFCVLDEVDAALDEANIGRFAEALRSLAHVTQFIVITHNRGTIEAADALYGVTAGDDSVSRIVSLRLDEAQALAERDRPELTPAR
jgi:chromosome segregation protein